MALRYFTAVSVVCPLTGPGGDGGVGFRTFGRDEWLPGAGRDGQAPGDDQRGTGGSEMDGLKDAGVLIAVTCYFFGSAGFMAVLLSRALRLEERVKNLLDILESDEEGEA